MQGFQKEEEFELPVRLKDEEMMLSARFLRRGYSYQVVVSIADTEIIFEPDEERNFRAMVNDPNLARQLPLEMIKQVSEALNEQFR